MRPRVHASLGALSCVLLGDLTQKGPDPTELFHNLSACLCDQSLYTSETHVMLPSPTQGRETGIFRIVYWTLSDVRGGDHGYSGGTA